MPKIEKLNFEKGNPIIDKLNEVIDEMNSATMNVADHEQKIGNALQYADALIAAEKEDSDE